jgi:hypothetical protein
MVCRHAWIARHSDGPKEMRRRYRFLRFIGCDWLTAAFTALLCEASDLPPNKVGIMHVVFDMDDHQQNAAQGGGEK